MTILRGSPPGLAAGNEVKPGQPAQFIAAESPFGFEEADRRFPHRAEGDHFRGLIPDLGVDQVRGHADEGGVQFVHAPGLEDGGEALRPLALIVIGGKLPPGFRTYQTTGPDHRPSPRAPTGAIQPALHLGPGLAAGCATGEPTPARKEA